MRLYAGTLSRSNGAKVFNSPVKINGLVFQKLSFFKEQGINYIQNPSIGKTADIWLKSFILRKTEQVQIF